MKISVCYVMPNLNLPVYEPLARRFISSYLNNPPGVADHDFHVLVNGPMLSAGQMRLFNPLVCHFHQCTNVGRDIGAYQWAAENVPCDLMVCLGTPVHFHKTGWLDRIERAFLDNGPALYGAWGFHQPSNHIRTTAFWLPPEMLKAYPFMIGDGQRYEFEHGGNSITQHALKWGFDVLQVTWSGVYPLPEWHHCEREECLMLDQHSDRIGF